MNLILYILPIIIFIISSVLLYTLSTDPKKKTLKNIAVRNILPGLVLGVTVFSIIKFKDAGLFNSEPMMSGNYFDT